MTPKPGQTPRRWKGMNTKNHLQNLLMCLLLIVPNNVIAESLDLVADRQTEMEIRAHEEIIRKDFRDVTSPEQVSKSEKTRILSSYRHLDPNNYVPQNLLQRALVFFDSNKESFKNQNFITIVDFSPRSDKFRFFLVDLKTGEVERFRTTHGKGSDPEDDGIANIFGNEVDSGKSSVGFARTAEVYSGQFGRSLRLDGLSATNSNMRRRAVVYHGWDGVREEPVIQQRSLGCITIDWKYKDQILDLIKEGSLLYADRSR